jgi:hypothetical protein
MMLEIRKPCSQQRYEECLLLKSALMFARIPFLSRVAQVRIAGWQIHHTEILLYDIKHLLDWQALDFFNGLQSAEQTG